jgi:opacity protein-like surface antigen
VRDREREVFTSSGQTYYVNGEFVPGPPSSYRRFNESGYQLGGGLEYSLQSHVYANLQYVYSRYRDHDVRNRLMGGRRLSPLIVDYADAQPHRSILVG